MKSYNIFFVFLAILFVVFPMAGSSVAERADSAYNADNYQLAQELYLQAVNEEGTSATLLYNLGNSYFRLGQPGNAILYYERALRLDPSNTEARTNLKFVNSRIVDIQPENGSFLGNIYNKILLCMHPDTWAWIALGLFVLGVSCVIVYFIADAVMLRKLGFFTALGSFVLFVFAVVFAVRASQRVEDHSEAIIIVPAVQLSTSPRPARTPSEEAFLLHEGTKLEIVDSLATQSDGLWYEVIVAEKDRAWIPSEAVSRI